MARKLKRRRLTPVERYAIETIKRMTLGFKLKHRIGCACKVCKVWRAAVHG